MSALLNQTFDDRDTAHFIYRGFWFTGAGSWNATSVGQSGTLASTNDLNANLTFTFPTPAIAFYYYAIPRANGGSYAICVDCDPNNRLFIPVDGFNATDDGSNPPIVLYSQTFSTPGVHEIIIRNQPDPRGTPPGNSQLTLDRIDLEVLNTNPPATTTTTATPTSDTSSNTSSHSSSPVGLIVGVVLAVLALLVIAGLFYYWLRLRRRNNPSEAPLPNMHQPHSSPTTSPSTLWGYSAGASPMRRGKPTHQPMMPSVTSTSSQPPPSASMSSSSGVLTAPPPLPPHHRRREQDAGPVPLADDDDDEDEETLPPEYAQVFSVDRRASRRRRSLPPPQPLPAKVPLATTEEEI